MERIILDARDAIGDLTPLKSDCGLMCGSACCRPDDDGQGGVMLLPTEVAGDWGHVVESDRCRVLVCDKMCERPSRPFLCRVFPLAPVLCKDGAWKARMDARSRAMCPIYRSGIAGLDRVFVKAVERAFNILSKDAAMNDFLRRVARQERYFRTQARL
ncbi:MAG: hypothetical protein Q4D04_10565 [Clostridia bacterium]|nr:hypothetical protein [Clostridia bacterium]